MNLKKLQKLHHEKKSYEIIVSDKPVAFGNTVVDEAGNWETTKGKRYLKLVMTQMIMILEMEW